MGERGVAADPGELQAPGAGRRRRARRGLEAVGRAAERLVHHAGAMTLMLWRAGVYTLTGRVRLRDVATQMFDMGVASLPLVLATAVLSGIVTSQQSKYQFSGGVPLYVLGSVVTEAIVLELGPVMTAIVLIGRAGARITAEFGTMKVSEQLDALASLGRDPVRVLAAPRLLAGVLVMPMLVALADVVGVGAGMLSAQHTVGLSRESFFYGARLYWHSYDLFYSMAKALAFGFVIPLISCHMGFETRGGAEGVGRATTSSVVAMTLAVLAVDALLPALLLN